MRRASQVTAWSSHFCAVVMKRYVRMCQQRREYVIHRGKVRCLRLTKLWVVGVSSNYRLHFHHCTCTRDEANIIYRAPILQILSKCSDSCSVHQTINVRGLAVRRNSHNSLGYKRVFYVCQVATANCERNIS